MKTLKNPHIVKLVDVFQTHNNTYIVTELCIGGDLKDLMQSVKFNEKQAIKVVQDILEALIETFKRGIVHRDIKPANILYDGVANYKLTDFGFAKKVDNIEGAIMQSLAGTPLYMSPQVLLR